MTIRKIILNRIPSQDEVLTIGKSGFTFGANFIKGNKLENKKSISFFSNDEDTYWLGFQFFDETGNPDSLGLMSRKGSSTRGIKGSELINNNRILKAIQNESLKADRMFPIDFDKNNSCYFILLRPSFETKIQFEKKSEIPAETKGIYRYRDQKNSVIYIGKGDIKDRAADAQRRDWGIRDIEYSIINNDEKCYYWESYYIDQYIREFGAKPPLNRIAGHG
jgi:hypothetical protein